MDGMSGIGVLAGIVMGCAGLSLFVVGIVMLEGKHPTPAQIAWNRAAFVYMGIGALCFGLAVIILQLSQIMVFLQSK